MSQMLPTSKAVFVSIWKSDLVVFLFAKSGNPKPEWSCIGVVPQVGQDKAYGQSNCAIQRPAATFQGPSARFSSLHETAFHVPIERGQDLDTVLQTDWIKPLSLLVPKDPLHLRYSIVYRAVINQRGCILAFRCTPKASCTHWWGFVELDGTRGCDTGI